MAIHGIKCVGKFLLVKQERSALRNEVGTMVNFDNHIQCNVVRVVDAPQEDFVQPDYFSPTRNSLTEKRYLKGTLLLVMTFARNTDDVFIIHEDSVMAVLTEVESLPVSDGTSNMTTIKGLKCN